MAAADLVVPASSPSIVPAVDQTRPIRVPSAAHRDCCAEIAGAVQTAVCAAALGVVEPPEIMLTFQAATRRFQRRLVVAHLEATRWNVAKTARRLGLARSHVYNLMDAMEISRPGNAGRSRHRTTRHA